MPEALLIDVPEAAKTLGISTSTAWRAIWAGRWPTVRIEGRRLVPRKFVKSLVTSACPEVRAEASN